jgi:site-specific DNA recombinase
VSEGLFGAVQAQLEENRQRRRDRPGGGRYLLQGLVVCKRCGYGCYGKPTSRASAKGKGKVPYAYYRCTGSDAYRFGGQRLCWNKQIRTDMLDAAVWDDVRGLLSEPERVRREYERRLQSTRPGPNQEVEHLGKLVSNVKKMISRLIDAYGDGSLDKSEFEPRISAARTRLSKLEEEHRQRAGEAAQEAELRLVIGQLEEFSSRVSQGLQEPDWDTRREVVRALVKKVEVDEQEIRIVYRVSPSPFEGGPQQGRSQHCWGRDDGLDRPRPGHRRGPWPCDRPGDTGGSRAAGVIRRGPGHARACRGGAAGPGRVGLELPRDRRTEPARRGNLSGNGQRSGPVGQGGTLGARAARRASGRARGLTVLLAYLYIFNL